ncbi:MAG: Trimeric GatFAB AmidoTransferase(AdT) complex subunit [Icmadophila ericetorum]|nr:Trimeric GatFAB AmidoTransferase(AdT) complex subunit [Icmadophila ericetorum]
MLSGSFATQAAKQLEFQTFFKSLNAFTSVKSDTNALKAAAKEADERQRLGHLKSPIDGYLIGVKDNICTTDLHSTCASKILHGFTSPYAATIVKKLEGAGASILGKTNLDEFGMGSHSTFSTYGPVQRGRGLPRHLSSKEALSAGGSSGGSAVAVATGQCIAALGTDTGGSVRLPAAYNGIVGFKPSYGLISRYGVVAYANSLDTVGIFAEKSEEVQKVFDTINGYDPRDPTSVGTSTRGRIAAAQLKTHEQRRKSSQMHLRDRIQHEGLHIRKYECLRIGVPLEYNIKELQPEVRAAWAKTLQRMSNQGHSVREVSLPATKLALAAYYIIAPAEASSNLAKYDAVRYGQDGLDSGVSRDVLYSDVRGEGLGEEVQRRIILGAYSLSASAIDNYFIQAQRVRRIVQRDFDSIFALRNPLVTKGYEISLDGVDILIAPTAPSMAPRLVDVESRSSLNSYSDDVLTVPASLAGLPAISVPFHPESKRPISNADMDNAIGMQVIGQYGDDEMVLHAAQLLERSWRNEGYLEDMSKRSRSG